MSANVYGSPRRAYLKDGMSAWEAAVCFNKNHKMIAKMLGHEMEAG